MQASHRLRIDLATDSRCAKRFSPGSFPPSPSRPTLFVCFRPSPARFSICYFFTTPPFLPLFAFVRIFHPPSIPFKSHFRLHLRPFSPSAREAYSFLLPYALVSDTLLSFLVYHNPLTSPRLVDLARLVSAQSFVLLPSLSMMILRLAPSPRNGMRRGIGYSHHVERR